MNATMPAHSTTPSASSNGLHLGLWAVQVLLALAFLGAGMLKLITPIGLLASRVDWVGTVPATLVRFIGVSELLGALGLILPAATRIKPVLTGLAALGLTVVMVLAVGVHVARGEGTLFALPLLLGVLAAFVAWGRLTQVSLDAQD